MVDNTGAFTNESIAALDAAMSEVARSTDGVIPRTKVPAEDGAKILTRQQLADPGFFNQIKEILFTEPNLIVVDTKISQLTYGGKAVDADSPAGAARIHELQAAWQARILNGNQLGNAIAGVQPNLDPPALGDPFSNGQADWAVRAGQ